MSRRLRRIWLLLRINPRRTLIAVGGVGLGLVVSLLMLDRDNGHATSTATTSSPSATSLSTSSVTAATSSTTTAASTTTASAPAPSTTAPPAATTTTAAPRRQMFALQTDGLAAMNSDGTGARLLVAGLFRNTDLSPDRSWLVMKQWSGQAWNRLVTINADGTNLRVIATGSWQSARISPDSTKIAAVEMNDALGPLLVIMKRDGTSQQRVDLPGGYRTNQVDWSPDGRKLAVTNSSSNGLAIYDLAAHTQTWILEARGTVWSPQWSPDGSLIAFNNGDDIVVIPAGGGTSRTVTSTPADPAFTWDGPQSLLFADHSTLYRIGVDGAGLTKIATGFRDPAS